MLWEWSDVLDAFPTSLNYDILDLRDRQWKDEAWTLKSDTVSLVYLSANAFKNWKIETISLFLLFLLL